jgi:hypothetical protein
MVCLQVPHCLTTVCWNRRSCWGCLPWLKCSSGSQPSFAPCSNHMKERSCLPTSACLTVFLTLFSPNSVGSLTLSWRFSIVGAFCPTPLISSCHLHYYMSRIFSSKRSFVATISVWVVFQLLRSSSFSSGCVSPTLTVPSLGSFTALYEPQSTPSISLVVLEFSSSSIVLMMV